MSNYHLHDRNLSYKAKGLLSFMLSLPSDWDYSLSGLVAISKESKDCIRSILNESNISYDYLTNGNRTSYIVKNMKNNNFSYSYKYDHNNNITHIYFNSKLVNQYSYDEYNQLIKEVDYISNEIIKYKYDESGNLLYKRVFDLKNNNLINEIKCEYNNLDWEDQLTKYNDKVITYDEIGNPLTIGNDTVLTWINGRQLNSYSNSIVSITYKYNKDDIRINKIVNNVETNYYLEGNQIVIKKTGDNVLYYIRNGENDLLAFKYNNVLYYYVKNNQNDIVGIMDTNGVIVAKYKYDSWGNIKSITDENDNDISNINNHIGNINPFRYRSYYYDKEIKLYYLNHRYYNPQWGRFINIDSILSSNKDILSHNLYLYCSNNPIMHIDYNGFGVLSLLSKTIKKCVKQITAKVVKTTKKIVSSTISKKNTYVAPKTTVSKINNLSSTVSSVVSTAASKLSEVSTLPDYSEELNKVLIKNVGQLYVMSNYASPAAAMQLFYDNVCCESSDWNYKNEKIWNADINVSYLGRDEPFLFNGNVITAEDFGNLNYGFTGAFLGFDDKILFIGGGYASKKGISIELLKPPYYGDNPNDHRSVKLGIDMYYNGLE